MWYDIPVVDIHTPHNVLPSVVRAMVNGVAFFVHRSSVLKWPWILFRALSLLIIAGCPRVRAATWSVNHDLLDYLEELRFGLRMQESTARTE